jgi:hypothetical protein
LENESNIFLVVAVVATQGKELMSMVSGNWLVEVKKRYLDLLE